ncbi:hypothetical protein A2U01_0060219, partial [Trifolium medium]|nr:hypothetical protein [Trifolium medium]
WSLGCCVAASDDEVESTMAAGERERDEFEWCGRIRIEVAARRKVRSKS